MECGNTSRKIVTRSTFWIWVGMRQKGLKVSDAQCVWNSGGCEHQPVCEKERGNSVKNTAIFYHAPMTYGTENRNSIFK